MQTSTVSSLRLTASLLLAFTVGCGGDDPPEASDDLRGQVSSDWTVIAEATLLDRAREALFGGTAYAVGGTMVDTAVAIPASSRNWADAITVPVAEDGTFSFDFPAEVTGTYVVVLVHSAAPIEERVVAYVTMGAGDDTMMAFPPIDEPLDLGPVRRSGDEAVSMRTVSETTSFTLSVEDLLAVAATDDAYKDIINGWLNYDADTGAFFDARLSFGWQGSMATLLRGEASADAMRFGGASVDVSTNALTAAQASAVCDGGAVLAMHPPEEVRNIVGRVWGPEAPIRTAPPRRGGMSQCSEDIAIGDDGRPGVLNLGFAEGRLTGLGEGFWNLRLDDTSIAAFDFSIRDPNESGVIQVPVAVPVVETDASGAISQVSLRWYLHDGSAYQEVSDPSRLENVLYGVKVAILGEGNDAEYVQLPSTTDSATFERTWVLSERLDGTGNGQGLRVDYRIGANEYVFLWGPSELEPIIEAFDSLASRPAVGASGTATLTVALTQPSSVSVTVDWATADGTATAAGNDYAAASGTLTFPPGTRTQTVSVDLPAPSAPQPESELFIELSNANRAALGRSRATLRLLSNAVVTVAPAGDGTVVEGEDLVLEVRTDEALPFDVTLRIDSPDAASSAREAVPSVDYVRASGSVTLTAGSTLQTFTVGTITEALAEGPEVILLLLREPSNARLASTLVAATLLDGARGVFHLEAPPRATEGEAVTITVTTDTAPSAPVPMSASYAGVDTLLTPTDVVGGFGPSPFMFPAGVTSHTFEVTPASDDTTEPDEALFVTLTWPTDAAPAAQLTDVATIVVQDPTAEVQGTCTGGEEGGEPARLELRWVAGHVAPQPIVVEYETADGSASAGTDFRALSGRQAFFDDPVEEEVPLTIELPILDDLDVEGEETFTVELTVPAGVRARPASIECAVTDDD